ncbi:MAG TPA: DNA polymerase IV [Clostridiales bacterium]|nr:DNA polymerase IV [Clostridiales bacterium]
MKDILHVDLNNFFASCECMINEEIRNKPVAVCGSPEERHGIVLAKNYLAKDCGVKTGHTIWQAKQLCPNLVVVLPNFSLYVDFSKKVRKILLDYTDLVEPFSIDESWLDVTNSKMFGSAEQIAEEIRQRVLAETGLTVSIGVSFNKIFAKLGSDLKKPNAITIINKQNFKDVVWKLPVSDMLMIGRATTKKLNDMGIYTIGELAGLSRDFLVQKFGKNGNLLYEYSNGIGNDIVKNYYEFIPPKSIGNSTTCYRDLTTGAEVKEVLTTLSQSVVSRMIESGFVNAKTIKLWVKDNALETVGKQCKFNGLSTYNNITKTAYELFESVYDWHLPVRALGISVCDFYDGSVQLDLFGEINGKKSKLDKQVLSIKNKFGENVLMQGNSLFDSHLGKPLGGLHAYQNSKNDKT